MGQSTREPDVEGPGAASVKRPLNRWQAMWTGVARACRIVVHSVGRSVIHGGRLSFMRAGVARARVSKPGDGQFVIHGVRLSYMGAGGAKVGRGVNTRGRSVFEFRMEW